MQLTAAVLAGLAQSVGAIAVDLQQVANLLASLEPSPDVAGLEQALAAANAEVERLGEVVAAREATVAQLNEQVSALQLSLEDANGLAESRGQEITALGVTIENQELLLTRGREAAAATVAALVFAPEA